jgi:hypothetical protein
MNIDVFRGIMNEVLPVKFCRHGIGIGVERAAMAAMAGEEEM